MEITEFTNDNLPSVTPIKEKMDIHIPDIVEGLPRYNGGVFVICGSGGSGKSSMLLGLFKTSKGYRRKFDNIYYVCPMSSFLSVQNHPFAEHDKVSHDLTLDYLCDLYKTLNEMKEEDDENDEQQYNCLLIDDMADALKDKNIQRMLNKILIKARHLKCMIIITLQAWKYMPLQMRRQVTNVSIFKPKSKDEWETVCKEIIMLPKQYWEQLYDYIFDKPYTHLDIDTKQNKIYRNFHELELKY